VDLVGPEEARAIEEACRQRMEKLFIAMELAEEGQVDPGAVAEGMARWEQRAEEAARGVNARPPDGEGHRSGKGNIPPGLIVLFLLLSAMATAWALNASVGAESELPVPGSEQTSGKPSWPLERLGAVEPTAICTDDTS
jgi:hypothetical protein